MVFKKKLATVVCTAVLALALPALAWANPSPQFSGQDSPTIYQPGQTTFGKSNTSITLGSFDGVITGFAGTASTASNVPADAVPICSFEVIGDATNVDLVFMVGEEFAGQKVTVFIEHGNGDKEQQVKTVANDGSVTVHVDRLSIFTIVQGDFGNGSSETGTATPAALAKSPRTNADLGGVAGATALVALAAGVTFVALRKQSAR